MGGVLAVAARELKEKWTVLVAALVAGLVALLVPLFSSLGRRDVRDARELAALVFAAAFAFGIAMVVGAGMITSELAERRHGFFFARPLSAGAIWGGKLLACWLLAVGSGLTVLLPAAAASRGIHLAGSLSPFGDPAGTFGIAAGVILGFALFAHAVTLMVRSHAPWLLALDAVLAVTVVMIVALALRALFIAYALEDLRRATAAGAVVALVAPLAAGFAQVSLGRTDIRRGHRVLSATLWGILGVAALLLAGYARWVQAAGVSDLTRLDGMALAPKGEWVFVTGRARGRGDYEPSFLVDTSSGRTVTLGVAGQWWLGGRFSNNGTRAIWLSPSVGFSEITRDVVTLDLTDPSSGPVTTPITISPERTTVLGLSPDGRSLALREGETISIADLPSGKLRASVRLPEALGSVRAVYAAPDRLRLLAWKGPGAGSDSADLRLFELDAGARSLTETGHVADVGGIGYWAAGLDPEREHLLTRIGPRSHSSVVLCDARTGARIATLAVCADFAGCKATILSDGTVAVGEAVQSGVRLRLFSAAGEFEREVPVGPGRTVRIGGQTTSSTLVVSTLPRTDAPLVSRDRETFVVDLPTGTVTSLGQGYVPVDWTWWWGAATVPAPGSVATRAFIDPSGRLVILDPATRTFRTVLSARWYGD